MPHIEFLADRRDAGKTVAAVLRARFNLTWGQAKKLVDGGYVRVAGFLCKDVALRVKNRNRIWIKEGTVELPKGVAPPALPGKGAKPKPRPKAATPAPAKQPAGPAAAPPMPLDPSAVVYSDDAVVVVNKPAGLTTMRSADEAAEFGTRGKAYLPKTLADFVPRLLGDPTGRVIPVHRIDRDTSGLVVFARTPAAASSLVGQFRKHTAERKYLALVRGAPADGRIESVFVRDRGDGRRGSGPADAPDGKRAVTRVKVKETFGPFALVECRLETGRTHQVRVHLGEAGSPLCGEKVYDRPVNGKPLADGSGAKRPMLHAAVLGFAHPATGDAVRWEVPPPADFTKLLGKLRSAAAGEAEAWDV